MTSSGPPAAGSNAAADSEVSVGLNVLRKRSDFLQAAKGFRQATAGFYIQARFRDVLENRRGIYVGYTCSKKVGNAVARNRAKRRLREIARLVLPEHGQPGWDYVLIGRPDTTENYPIGEMCADLKSALINLHRRNP